MGQETSQVQAIKQIDLTKYTGTWYDVASLPFFWTRGCTKNQANYKPDIDEDGKPCIQVTNSCIKDGNKDISVGRAYQQGKSGALCVSFFFTKAKCSNYNIVYLEEDVRQKRHQSGGSAGSGRSNAAYKYSCVIGKNPKYAWILAREKHPPAADIQRLVLVLKKHGVDIYKLVNSWENNELVVQVDDTKKRRSKRRSSIGGNSDSEQEY